MLAQLKSLEGSKMASDIATSFISGFAAAALMMLLPDINLADPGKMIATFAHHLTNPAWLYIFFNTAFGAALSASFGLRLKSAFDSLDARPANNIPSDVGVRDIRPISNPLTKPLQDLKDQ